ncbi:MAG: glycosyltransferase, partial [Acidobacteriaceae bacterium]|nr:glycosyltransferase [Acidobacteriaceae bacterium]
MIGVLWGIAALAGAYQFIALLACLRQWTRKAWPPHPDSPGVSILKPLRGTHAGFDEALRSHLSQNYPAFELLAGHRHPNDPAVPDLERSGVPHFVCPQQMPNAKVAVLAGLLPHARYPILIVNDADIAVPPDYIRDVTAPLADPRIGVVTCLYRAEGSSLPARFEALAVATDFAPSTLVAPLFGVSEFGFGSTLAFRRTD